MFILDKEALLLLSVHQSSEVPRERIIGSKLVLVVKFEEVSPNQLCQGKVDGSR